MKRILATMVAVAGFLVSFSIPKYGEGGMQLRGIQLLQDSEDANAYYYIPRFPRMATHEDGTYEFMFIKYVGKGSAGPNGGLFHALIEFTLPGDEVDKLQDTLRVVLNNRSAKIIGPVPLQQAVADGEKGVGSFQVVSSILGNTAGTNAFTQNIVTSGFAPFLPGSKAAIAAKLSQEGATLLWESLQGTTSDVSVSLSGYYEAYVKAYRATVTAEMTSVYQHYSRLSSFQEGFTKDQMRRITDDMLQNQVLKIESFDRTASLGIKADEMKALLNLITDKLIELMFDTKAGWAKAPERETAIEPDQIKGRQERGWFSQTFGGAQDVPYYTDNQFVLKRREDIRTNKFYLDLTQSTSIKVPVHTSGNLAGVYKAMTALGPQVVDKYFRIVNLDDATYQKRDVSFMIDGGYAESFNDIFNFVSINFRKKYPGNTNDATSDLMFTRKNIESTTGGVQQMVSYPRLGISSSDWLEYEYKVSWNLKGSNYVIKEPADESQWIKATGPGITLLPPISKRKVTLEVDKSAFADSGRTSTVVIKFLVTLGGKPMIQRQVILRSKDATNIQEVVLFHDPGEAVAYQVTQFTPQGEKKGPLKELTTDFIMVGASEIIR